MAIINPNSGKKSAIIPKKRLGQNFLTQIGAIQKLVDAAAIQPGETILEIGPGTGNLTAQLAKTSNEIIAVEKDMEMLPILKEKFDNFGNVCILTGDALKYEEAKIATPYKIAANLPFYLTAPIIRKFLESANPPLSMTVIVQKEVAQRICAHPPQMNLLAIATQFYATTKIIAHISKGNFWPVPKVDCAILQIVPHIKKGDIYEANFVEKFFQIAKAGFSHPRKQLAGNFGNELNLEKPQIIAWLAKNNIGTSQRAETLSVENWIGLTQSFNFPNEKDVL